MNSEVKEQNKPYRRMERGRECSEVKSGLNSNKTVIVEVVPAILEVHAVAL